MHKLVRRHRQMVVLGLHNHARVLRPVVDMVLLLLLLLMTTIIDHYGMLMTSATRFKVVQKSVIVVVIVVDLVKLVVVMVPVEVPIRGHAVPVEATGHRKVLIHVVVLLLVLLDERRVRDVRGVQVGLPVRAAAAVGTGRKWSQHVRVRAVPLRVVRLVDRIVVRVQELALVRVHQEAALAAVLLVKVLLRWNHNRRRLLLLLMVMDRSGSALDLHLVQTGAVVVKLVQLQIVAHFLHQQWVVRRENRLLLLLLVLRLRSDRRLLWLHWHWDRVLRLRLRRLLLLRLLGWGDRSHGSGYACGCSGRCLDLGFRDHRALHFVEKQIARFLVTVGGEGKRENY